MSLADVQFYAVLAWAMITTVSTGVAIRLWRNAKERKEQPRDARGRFYKRPQPYQGGMP